MQKIEEYDPVKKRKILIIDDMIADMINNKKINTAVTELFIRGTKIEISSVFITHSYYKVPKEVTLSSTLFLIMKVPKKENFNRLP